MKVKVKENAFRLIPKQCLHCELWRSRNSHLTPIRLEQELKQQTQVFVATDD